MPLKVLLYKYKAISGILGGDNMRYNFLEGKIAEGNIKKKDIAKVIGIAPRTLSDKLSGCSGFTWEEVKIIKNTFFPDIDIERLFAVNDNT